MSASFENEPIDKADKQYSTGTKKLNQNSKHVERILVGYDVDINFSEALGLYGLIVSLILSSA